MGKWDWKRKLGKRALACLLSGIMAFSCAADMTAFAGEPSDDTGVALEPAVAESLDDSVTEEALGDETPAEESDGGGETWTQTEALGENELKATKYAYGTLILLSNGGQFSSGKTKIVKNFTGQYLSDGVTPYICMTIPSDVPSRTGYTFMGWDGPFVNQDPSEDGTVIWRYYGDRSEVPGITSYGSGGSHPSLYSSGYQCYSNTNNDKYYLVAVWKINTYDVTYNYNNGSASSSESKTYNQDYTITSVIPTREGYDFLGWDTSSTAKNVVWNPGDTYSANKALDLYAVWKPHTYTINYHGNGGDGAPESQTKTHDVDLSIPDTVPSRAGYTFLGWSENMDDVVPAYRTGDALPEKSMDLYAVWRIVLPAGSVTVIGNDESEGDRTVYEDILFNVGGVIKAFDIVIEYPDFLKYEEYVKLEDGFEQDVYVSERTEGTKHVLELSFSGETGISVTETIPLGRIVFSVGDSVNYEYGSYSISFRKSESYFIGEDKSVISLDYAGGQTFEYLPYKATGIEITGENSISEASKYSITFTPEKTTDKSVEWSVDNDSVATIDKDGVLTPHKNGTVTITAKTLDGSGLNADFTVEVVGQKARIQGITVPNATWKQEFSPDIFAYTLYIPEYCDTVTLTAEFDAGTLLCEGYGYLTSGIAKTFTIATEMQSLVFIKSETDYTDTRYVVSFIKDSYAGEITESGLVYKSDGNDGVIITGYTGAETFVEIPAKIGEKNVCEIAGGAFSSNNSLNAVIIAPREADITVRETAFSDTVGVYNLSESILSGVTTKEYTVTIVKDGDTLDGQKVIPADLAEKAGYNGSVYDEAYYYTDTDKNAAYKWYLGDGQEINASNFKDVCGGAGQRAVFYYTKDMACDDIAVYVRESDDGQNEISVDVFDKTKALSKDYHYTCEIAETGEKDNGVVTVTIRGIINNGYSGIKIITKSREEITEKLYSVRFDTRGHGSAPDTLRGIKAGSLIDAPASPKEEGYEFTGWFRDAECTQKWDFTSDVVLEDMTLYAGWISRGEAGGEGLKVELADPGEAYTYTGSAIKPIVIVTNNGEELTAGVDYTVRYGNNTKVSTDRSKAKITVTGKANLTGSASTTFDIVAKDIADDDVAAGDIVIATNTKPAPVLVYNNKKLGSGDYTLKVLGADGSQTAVGRLTADATLVVTGKGNYKGTREIPVKVVAKSELKKFTVTVGREKLTYNGKEQKISFTVTDSKKKSAENPTGALEENIDYIVVYPENITDAGTVKFTVIGIGDYTGSVTKSYKIKPLAAETGSMTTSGVAADPYPYSRKGVTLGDDLTVTYHKPAAGETAAEDVILTEGKDYKVTYSNNKKVSTDRSKAKYTVTFLGNYKGTRAVSGTFSISAAPLSNETEGLKIAVADKAYSGKAGTYVSKPYVTIDGVALKTSDYTVKYYRDAAMTNEITGRSKLSLADGASKAAVYVKITGKGNYAPADANTYATAQYRVRRTSKETGNEIYDLSKARVTVLDAEGRKTTKAAYTGNALEPEVKVEYKIGKTYVTLDEGTDYEVTYVNNVNKGRATVMITGTGASYVGSKTASFSVVARNLRGVSGLLDDLFGTLGLQESMR